MRKVFLLLTASSFLLAVSSCGNSGAAASGSSNERTEKEETKDEQREEVSHREGEDGRTAQKNYQGVVYDRTSTEGCDFIIISEIDGIEQTFVPHDLKPEFRKDKLDVEFSYVMSRRPTKCTLGTPIILGSIKVIR